MIHYGLQFKELVRKSSDMLADAICALGDAENETRHAERRANDSVASAVSARNEEGVARVAMKAAKKALDELVSLDPKVAVENYKAKTGRYPL